MGHEINVVSPSVWGWGRRRNRKKRKEEEEEGKGGRRNRMDWNGTA